MHDDLKHAVPSTRLCFEQETLCALAAVSRASMYCVIPGDACFQCHGIVPVSQIRLTPLFIHHSGNKDSIHN